MQQRPTYIHKRDSNKKTHISHKKSERNYSPGREKVFSKRPIYTQKDQQTNKRDLQIIKRDLHMYKGGLHKHKRTCLTQRGREKAFSSKRDL